MIEILVCDSFAEIKELYQKNGLEADANALAVRAMSGELCLGYCLFQIQENVATVFAVEPVEDLLLADGLLRSALHVGTERGITEAFYANEKYETLYQKIRFLEDKTEKRLRLQNLFSDCCCSQKDS